MTRPTSTPTLAELLVEGARVERRRLRGIVRAEIARLIERSYEAERFDVAVLRLMKPRKP